MSEPAADDGVTLGPCCVCAERPATVLVMLDRKAPIPGHGWGCVACNLAMDGAQAVACESCAASPAFPATLRFACRGFPGSEGRVPVSDLTGAHAHDLAAHGSEIAAAHAGLSLEDFTSSTAIADALPPELRAAIARASLEICRLGDEYRLDPTELMAGVALLGATLARYNYVDEDVTAQRIDFLYAGTHALAARDSAAAHARRIAAARLDEPGGGGA